MKNNFLKIINKIIYNLILFALIISFNLIFPSCSNLKPFEAKNAEEAFNEGVRLFNKKNYIDAQTFFDMIKLQYPASNYADDAQFYIAEIYFNKKEYIMASFNYSRLKAMYPGSEYQKISLYKSGYAQYLLSPIYDLDQNYTKKAIKTFQEYQLYYPEQDSMYENASKFIQELRDKLGEKDFRTAELYRTLESPQSSLIYYDIIINNYDDTSFLEPSIYGKIESLFLLDRYDEANMTINTYNKLFPDGKYKLKIENLYKNYIVKKQSEKTNLE